MFSTKKDKGYQRFNRHQPQGNVLVFPARENAFNPCHAIKKKKTVICCNSREKIQPVPSLGKHLTHAMRSKTIIWCNGRKNIQPVPSPGKLLAGVMHRKRIQPVSKRGKAIRWCYWCNERAKLQTVSTYKGRKRPS